EARASRGGPERGRREGGEEGGRGGGGPAGDERRGQERSDREQPAVLEQFARAAAAVRAEGVVRVVVDDDLARQVDLAAGVVDALAQLGILVRDRAGVVEADGLED